ncbi:hypothetical protein CC86DRAFT_158529 [Ophiobolus disseminans]|uniref:Uncharacterized protein n=1 Tax=Ophiobolus disseminans TaxID=1469910 RepID=A0A6A6ZCE4_9PLEO|nr:hypothetical protein CC86DRAFT_158529 [Ophiobolus disseminans]
MSAYAHRCENTSSRPPMLPSLPVTVAVHDVPQPPSIHQLPSVDDCLTSSPHTRCLIAALRESASNTAAATLPPWSAVRPSPPSAPCGNGH